MAEESYFDRFFNRENNQGLYNLGDKLSELPAYLSGLDADTLEYLESLERDNTIPLTMKDQIGQRLGNIIPDFVDFGLDTGENIKTSIDEFLSGDSATVAGLKDRTISEDSVDLTGLDLVEFLGPNLQTDMLPEEFKMVRPGQSNLSDPTGSGRIKARPTTMGEFELTGKNLEPYNPIGGIQTIDPELQSEAFGDLEFELEKEKQREIDAVNFRKQEEKLTQGGLNSMTIEESDKINAESKKMTQEQQEEGFLSAMDDFFEGARGAGPEVPKDRTIAEYKKAFSEATGIDTSGKVDKKDALMAFGLALMQNKAGKGFNVSKMLTEVGVAGDKALPALNKAKERARQGALAGGKYALQTQSSDKAVRAAANEKAMQREQYYVYQRGPDGAPFAKLDTGDLFHLSKYELNELMNDPKFDKGYSFITGKDYLDLQDTGTPTDFGDPFGKETKISLLGGDIEGVNPIYIVDGQRPDGNYKGQKKEKSFLQSDAKSIAKNFIKEQKSILKEQDEFSGLISNIQSGVSIPKQISSSIIQFGRNLGLDLNDGPTQIAQARKKLEKIQLLNATEILQESGKTLSDADRERVSKFVGTIDLGSADDALILQSLGRVYDIVLQARQRDLDTAVLNLGDSFGITFEVGNDAPPTQKELDAMNKEYGTSFTMENYYTPKAGE